MEFVHFCSFDCFEKLITTNATKAYSAIMQCCHVKKYMQGGVSSLSLHIDICMIKKPHRAILLNFFTEKLAGKIY